MTLTTIIVDDEPLARNLLRAILEEIGDIQVIAECKNGFEAVEAVMRYSPDVMFLDIEMPEMNGFAVINAIQADILPKIIFTTAYAEYAVEAFRVEALNYVLKPLDDQKIRESVKRVKAFFDSQDDIAAKSTLLKVLEPSEVSVSSKALIVKDTDTIAFLNKDEIDWVEADGDYVCIHNDKKTRLVRATLKSVEAKLWEANFQRIHRSTIVNLDRVSEIISAQKGEAILVMQDGQRLKVSRSYGSALKSKLL